MRILSTRSCSLTVVLSAAMLLGLHAKPCTGADQQATAGTTASLVREAIERDAFGLHEEREALLKGVIALNPDSTLARSYLGYMKSGGVWVDAKSAGASLANERTLRDYEQRRSVTFDNAKDHIELADWCKMAGLLDQERAHLLRALDFTPDDAAVRARLGHTSVGGKWVTRQEMQASVEEQQQQAAAFQKWAPEVANLRSRYLSSMAYIRVDAEKKLRAITDPDAIYALEVGMANAGERGLLLLVEIIGPMDDFRAVRLLARIAVESTFPAVRESATKQLAKRDQQAYVPQLLASMHGPVRSQMSLAMEADGRLLYHHEFIREAQDGNEQMVLDTRFARMALPGGDARETLDDAVRRARREAARREWQAQVQNFNTQQLNDRISWVLATATGVNTAETPEQWWNWWNRKHEAQEAGTKGTSVIRRETLVSIPDQLSNPSSDFGSASRSSPSYRPRHECFVAGTPVVTSRGPKGIETVRVGDMVLTQNIATGELAYKPVLRTTQRPKMPLVRAAIGGEEFVCTGGHLFWVAQEGWRKARELKPGSSVHAVGGMQTVNAVGIASEAETYNLVIDEVHNYFVGEQRLLTHDNTPRGALDLALVAPGVSAK